MNTSSTHANAAEDSIPVDIVETKEEHTETATCRYSSKPCSEPRAVKKTGDLHSFCEFHRLMANRNQRRCEQKRRTKRQLEKATQKRAPTPPQRFQTLEGAAPAPPLAVENKYKRRRSTATSTTSPTSVASSLVVVSLPTIDTRSLAEPEPKFQAFQSMSFASESTSSLEPYAHPVPLREEDLQYLFMTVVDSTYVHTAPFGVDANRAFVV